MNAAICGPAGPMADDGVRSAMDDQVFALQALVAQRVRKAREARGVPRRVLSDQSGVSQRYLAQLEAGEGNISIGLLARVAAALDYRIEWLVGGEGPPEAEAMRVAELFQAADKAVRDDVLRALSAERQGAARANRICLIGLRGAGKSTLGALAAQALDLPFLELNDQIERGGGMPVAEIMALYGPEGYRQLELEALERTTAQHETVILAAAGGIVDAPETFQKLLAHYHTIWLKAAPEEHMDRVRAQGDERPMANNPEAMAQLKSLLKNRDALYAQAGAQLDTAGVGRDASLQQLIALIRACGDGSGGERG